MIRASFALLGKEGAVENRVLEYGQHFLNDPMGTVIVLPSAHRDSKSGISYNDACAMGEICANLQKLKKLDVRTPELLGNDISKNLIILGGKKANRIAKEFQSSKKNLTFDLEDGVIYDKETSVAVTTRYLQGEKRTIDNVATDYGLIVYTNNPFGQSTKVLHVAGIRGCGTLAAAIAVSDGTYIHKIEKLIKRHLINRGLRSQLENTTIEILVEVSASNGKVMRDSLSIEKVKVSDGRADWKWESEEYLRLKKVTPHKLCIDVIDNGSPESSVIKARINDREIRFAKSPGRLKVLHILAEQAKEDYLNQSANEGWVNALELGERLWQTKTMNGVTQLAPEIKREISNAIIVWARHLERQGKLRLDENGKLDHDYINSEVLVFDLQVKKKIVDLVYLINQDLRDKVGLGFQVIDSQPGFGYRINFHPALMFITHRAGRLN